MSNDPIGDMITRIRNGQQRRKASIVTPGSRLRASLLSVLKAEGYIQDFMRIDNQKPYTEFLVELKYYNGKPVIQTIQRVSKPGRRVYSSVADLPRVADGLGVTIVSTPMGVMPDHEAREQNCGGEILCMVF